MHKSFSFGETVSNLVLVQNLHVIPNFCKFHVKILVVQVLRVI